MNRVISCVALAIVSTAARADFVAPNGSNYGWTRGSTPNSAYAQWEIFSSPAGPNTPDVGSFLGGTAAGGAPAWNVFDSSGQGIVTGSGNIYSFAAPVSIHVSVPSFGHGGAFTTTILLQVRTQGTEIQAGSVKIGGIEPAETQELLRQPAGMGGFLVDTLYRWELPGNAAGYEVRFDGATSSMSTDRIAIDMFTAGACYANCDGNSGVPALTANDFACFLSQYAGGVSYANCDGSSGTPTLTANDFACFLNAYAAGCP
jgi:hypothetical protein